MKEKRYSISWFSPYLKEDRKRTLTMTARNKEEAVKLHERLFPSLKRKVKVLR